LSGADRLRIAQEIAMALSYLHNKGIVHGDVKPANVLLTDSKTARLCDFGLSASATDSVSTAGVDGDADADATTIDRPKPVMRKSVVGTPLYMAPEILDLQRQRRQQGDGIRSDSSNKMTYDGCAADVYAFAILLYQLLTLSSFPVAAGSLANVLTGSRPPLPMNCPEHMTALLQQCWDQDPHSRPPFRAVVRELQKIRENEVDMDAISTALEKCSYRRSSSRQQI